MLSALDGAYTERNRLVAYLARQFPSGLKKTAIEGWDPVWHNCVYIDTNEGQLSWHYHDRDAHLFDGLPPFEGEWDGHTTEEKYQRLLALTHAMPVQDTILMSRQEYIQLLKDSERLARLDAGGVDNWDWYGASLYPDDEEPFDEFCERIDKQFAYI